MRTKLIAIALAAAFPLGVYAQGMTKPEQQQRPGASSPTPAPQGAAGLPWLLQENDPKPPPAGATGRPGARASGLRRHNLSTILEHLHLSGPASRSELGLVTGLNRSTIADLVQELVSYGLALEEGVHVSRRVLHGVVLATHPECDVLRLEGQQQEPRAVRAGGEAACASGECPDEVVGLDCFDETLYPAAIHRRSTW